MHGFYNSSFFIGTRLTHPKDSNFYNHGEFSVFYEDPENQEQLICRTVEEFKYEFLLELGIAIPGEKEIKIIDDKNLDLYEYVYEFKVKRMLNGMLESLEHPILLESFRNMKVEQEVNFSKPGQMYSKLESFVKENIIDIGCGVKLSKLDKKILKSIKKSMAVFEKMNKNLSSYMFDLHLGQFIFDEETEEVFCIDLICEL